MARLTFRRPQNAAAQRRTADAWMGAPSGIAIEPAAGATEDAVGPGWFESTFDLWHGLDVREEMSPPQWIAVSVQCSRSGTSPRACTA